MSRTLRAIVVGASAATLALPGVARAADPTLQECVAANERSGPLKQAGKLREARTNLIRCSASSCPAVVRDDCISGATRLEQAIPTIVFAAQDASGNDTSAVSVTMDGQPLADRLDGAAIEADPGDHVFTFTAAGAPAIERHFILREGEKNRRETILLVGAAPAPTRATTTPPTSSVAATAPAEPPRGGWSTQKTVALVLGGVGVIGIGVGAAFGVMAHNAWEQAKTDCGRGCSATSAAQSEADDAHGKATIANITMGIGAAALVAGAITWLLAPSGSPSGSAQLTPFIAPGAGGIALRGGLP